MKHKVRMSIFIPYFQQNTQDLLICGICGGLIILPLDNVAHVVYIAINKGS